MAKKSRKKRKESKTANVPAITILRSKVDKWLNGEILQDSATELKYKLEDLQQGVKPDGFLSALLGGYHRASKEVQGLLDEHLPSWLEAQGYVNDLYQLVKDHKITGRERETAFLWLVQVGAEITELQELELTSPFFKAFEIGDEWQSMLVICYYVDHRKQHATGINFLIDGNPPWYGSIKDAWPLPKKPPEKLMESFFRRMSRSPIRDVEPRELEEGEAKTQIIEALLANRERGIRLPRDCIRLREPFLTHILALENEEYTPEFAVEDFDELCSEEFGKSADDIVHFEQTVGRYIEGDDGEEIFIDAKTAKKMMEEESYSEELDDE